MAAAPLPASVAPELATLVDAAPAGDGWIHEIKYDGYRLLARVDGGRVRLMTRRGNDWTARFPTLERALTDVPAKRALLDGEVVVFDEHGVSRFQRLQNALDAANSSDVVYVVFDLLHLDGRDLRALPLLSRKDALRRLVAPLARRHRGVVRYSDHVVGRGAAFHDAACRRELEGIISKRADAAYVSARTRDWVKVKCHRSQEFVVVGWSPPQGARSAFGALLLAVNETNVKRRTGERRGKVSSPHGDAMPAGPLKYVGRVGTGFSDASLGEIHARLRRIEVKAPPVSNPPTGADVRGVRWVDPRLVAQVRFAEWTSDGLLRHPAFLGLREDQPVRDIVRERVTADGGAARAKTRHAKTTDTKTDAKTDAKTTSRASRGGIRARQRPETRRSPRSTRSDAAAASSDGSLNLLGVRLTHPERVLWPEAGITKERLARHYARVAAKMLPFVKGRPLAIVRCPEGRTGPCFFQKHGTPGMPPAVKAIRVRESSGSPAEYLMVDSAAGLVGLAQIGALEIHVWGARADDPDRPDRAVFDLDPAPEVPWSRVVDAALEVRARLRSEGYASTPRSTGGKGLHVVVDLSRRRLTWDQVKALTRRVAESMAADAPEKYVSKALKAARRGKIFVDWLRNIRGATAVAPYSPRAREGAPVAVPLTWAALARQKPPFATLARRSGAARK